MNNRLYHWYLVFHLWSCWSWQLVYQLFTTNVEPGEEVKVVMEMAKEAVRAQERDPYTAFSNRVRELNYGNSYFFRVCMITWLCQTFWECLRFSLIILHCCAQPIRINDLRKVDPLKACEYFNNCFKDPSTFTVVIVGNIDPAIACPLMLRYLVRCILFFSSLCLGMWMWGVCVRVPIYLG